MSKQPKLMNQKRMREAIQQSGLDALMAMSIENVGYVAETTFEVQRHIKERIAVAILPADGSPTLLCRSGEVSRVKEESWISDVRPYYEFEHSPIEVLADILAEKGLTKGCLGIEMHYLLAQYYLELCKLMPSAEFVDSEPLIDEVKMIKTPAELELLSSAYISTEKAAQLGYEMARPGDTERSLKEWMSYGLLRFGADEVGFLVLASGVRSCHKHAVPSDSRIEKGETVRVDLGGLFASRYRTDVARMAVVGEVSTKQRDTYRRLVEVHNELIERLRPGASLSAFFEEGKKLMESSGIPLDKHHLGHSIGTAIHEMPFLGPHETHVAEPNMVFALEPSYMDEGVARYHIEDLIWVSDEGPKKLSTYTDTSEMFVIA